MVSIVATGEAAKQRLIARGITPGKITSGSVTRDRSNTRTTRSASGEVLETKEVVYVDDAGAQVARGTPGSIKAEKTTTYNQPAITSTPGTSAGGLSDYEQYAIVTKGGGMSLPTGEEGYIPGSEAVKDGLLLTRINARRDSIGNDIPARVLETRRDNIIFSQETQAVTGTKSFNLDLPKTTNTLTSQEQDASLTAVYSRTQDRLKLVEQRNRENNPFLASSALAAQAGWGFIRGVTYPITNPKKALEGAGALIATPKKSLQALGEQIWAEPVVTSKK